MHRAAIDNLTASGTKAWGVHPTRREVRGIECVPTAADLPESPDIALLLVGHQRIEALAADAIAAGARSLIVPGLGREAGSEAVSISRSIAAMADRAGIPMIGPNCIGVAVPGGASAWVGTLGREIKPGNVSAIVHSGSVGEALAALGPRVGFRSILSIGSEADRDVSDIIAAMATDPGTEAVGIFLETIRRPGAFREALTMLREAGKPVVCLRVGRSQAGTKATLAHTDAVLTPNRAFSALAREVEMIEVDDFGEMVETLELLGHRRRPAGSRIAAVTQSGGQAALFADLMSETGLPMADFGPDTTRSLETLMGEGIPVCNPLDAWTIDDTVGSYLRIFQAIADSGEFDVLALQLDQTPFTGEIEIQVGLQLLEALIEATADKPVAPVMISGQSSESVAEIRHLAERHDVPLLRASEFAIRALARVSRWADRTIVWDAGRDSGPPASTVHLGEFRSSQILSAAGIRFPERELADSADEAVAAARRIGLPVVLKSNEIAHRSAVSAVTLGLKTLAGVAAEFDALEGPVIVASQVAAGPELYIGGRHDGRFGPIVCVGWGGQALEHRDNVSCALAPLTREAALSLTGSIAGLREVAPDELIESFVDVILATATFLESSQVGTAVDMNPVVLVAGRGAIALDALVVPGEG
ncbi:MAG: hypothetical protein BGO23_10020 [Solirubrobacterales bacterium 67-14]|nr:MAG: hypothetical protein BGO23_10020 [Solirubrobacterales bacterium 67-14]